MPELFKQDWIILLMTATPLSNPVLEAALPNYDKPESVTVDARELLCLLDYVNRLVIFCSANTPDKNLYYLGSLAMWAVAHRLAGNDDIAKEFIAQIAALNTNGIEAMMQLDKIQTAARQLEALRARDKGKDDE